MPYLSVTSHENILQNIKSNWITADDALVNVNAIFAEVAVLGFQFLRQQL
jgi:hypothetical protein